MFNNRLVANKWWGRSGRDRMVAKSTEAVSSNLDQGDMYNIM